MAIDARGQPRGQPGTGVRDREPNHTPGHCCGGQPRPRTLWDGVGVHVSDLSRCGGRFLPSLSDSLIVSGWFVLCSSLLSADSPSFLFRLIL